MTNDYESCERCSRDVPEGERISVSLDDEWMLCEGCVSSLNDDVVYYDPSDRYTEEQHERAISLLSEQDEVECVISSYEDRAIVIHTDYVSSNVVTDFCRHFGFSIEGFGPVWPQESTWPCIAEHGPTFEIKIRYRYNSNPPIPTSVRFEKISLDLLNEHDKQF